MFSELMSLLRPCFGGNFCIFFRVFLTIHLAGIGYSFLSLSVNRLIPVQDCMR